MCGRFVQTNSPTFLAEHFDVDEVALTDDDFAPSWNVAPRAEVLTIVEKDDHRRLGRMRWGLVPSWAVGVGVGDRMINARAESVMDKPAFRAAFERRRCIIPADGFYEWARTGGAKQPMFIHARSGAPLAFAGIWEVWRDAAVPDSPLLRTCAVITTAANALVAPIHDRMPVMLDPSEWDRWLDRDDVDVAHLTTLLDPAPEDLLECWPVGSRVNSARHDDASLIVREDPLTLFG